MHVLEIITIFQLAYMVFVARKTDNNLKYRRIANALNLFNHFK